MHLFLKILLVFIFISFQFGFETIKKEKINLESYDTYLLVILEGAECHECILKLATIIESKSKFKSIVAIKSNDNIIERRRKYEYHKKMINPDLWLFFSDEKYISQKSFKHSPNVIIKKDKIEYIYSYEELFMRPNDNSKINELFNKFKE